MSVPSSPERSTDGRAATGLGWPLTRDPVAPSAAAGLGWPTDAPTSPEERS